MIDISFQQTFIHFRINLVNIILEILELFFVLRII